MGTFASYAFSCLKLQSYCFIYMLVFYFQVFYENTEGYVIAPFFHGRRGTVLTLLAPAAQAPSAEAILWYHGGSHSTDDVMCSWLCPPVYGNIARRKGYQSFGGLLSLTVSLVSWNKLQKLGVIFCSGLTFREIQDTETVTATPRRFPPFPDQLSDQS